MKGLAVFLLIAIPIGLVMRSSSGDGPVGVVSGEAVSTIAKGDSVDLDQHLEDEVWTLVMFTADW